MRAETVDPEMTWRMPSMAMARVARSPEVYGRKKPRGSASNRSHTADCSPELARPSMRMRAIPWARLNSEVAVAQATSTRVICSSWERCAPGITVLKSMPVASAGTMLSTEAQTATQRRTPTSRAQPCAAKRSTSRTPSAFSGNGR
jgi:hypothetical protein